MQKNQDVNLTESKEYCIKPLVEIGSQIVTIIDKRIVEKLHIKGNLLVSQSITKDGLYY